ncbi:MAG: S41 family peptidase [Roseburia sp.]|nr:S41 family peptidase [Roseburia sp.]
MDNDNRYFDMDSIPPQQPAEGVDNKTGSKEKAGGRAGVFISGMFLGSLVALLVSCTVFWVSSVQQKSGSSGKANQDDRKEAVVLSSNKVVNKEFLDKIESLEAIIESEFYLHEVSDEDLRNGIYKGMLEALDDAYSEYYTSEELEELLKQTSGTYYGIGAYVGLDTETQLPKISGVIKDTPAQAAKLRANDLIYEVNGESTYGLSLTEAVALIKGEEGTQVVLTILRDGETLEIPVTRAKVETPTVESKMLENQIGYIQILEFDDVTTDQFAEALAVLKGSDMKGLILDLRANPGGNLDTVVDIAKMLLPEGLIVYTEDKAGRRAEYKCDGKRRLELPLVVLVDMNSASAAEILAGAIQDYEIGTLVGTTTFGKGIVQSVMPMKDGSAIKLTVSSYYTPKGRNIHGTGIEPDILCEFDGETYYATDGKEDNQLDKAVEVMQGMIGE